MDFFWGTKITAEKPVSYNPERPLHLTQVTLEEENVPGRTLLKVKVGDQEELVISSLRSGSSEQAPLNILFDADVPLEFSVTGKGTVHLLGNHEPFFNDDDNDDDFSDEEDFDENELDLLEDLDRVEQIRDINSEDEDENDDDENDDDDQEEGDKDDQTEQKEKDNKKQKGQANAQKKDQAKNQTNNNNNNNNNNGQEKKKQVKKETQPKEQAKKLKPATKDQANSPQSPSQKKVTFAENAQSPAPQQGKKRPEAPAGTPPPPKKQKQDTPSPKPEVKRTKEGLVYEDLVVGNGKQSVPGRNVSVGYVGKLQNGKVFDKSANFQFRLGVGDVIKGWDIGVAGMKVGGKRKLTIPPQLAYGARGAPPDIPPNSTLIFEVTLKNAN